MHFLMWSSPTNTKVVDEFYQAEYNAACKFGDVHLCNIDDLYNKSVKLPKAPHPNTPILYHGWMLDIAHYQQLYDQLQANGYQLINTPKQYANCHYFDNWYSTICDLTPTSICIERTTELRPMLDKVLEFRERVNSPLVIKDSVKSLKHEWHRACYIPRAANAVRVAKILATFFYIKDEIDDFKGKLIVRQFVPMQQHTTHAKSGMPMSQELRCLVLYGKIIYTETYWDAAQQTDIKVPTDLLEDIAGRIHTQLGSNLFTIDVGLLTNDKFVCIEVGDGQVSAIPDHVNKEMVFKNIAMRAEEWHAKSVPSQTNL